MARRSCCGRAQRCGPAQLRGKRIAFGWRADRFRARADPSGGERARRRLARRGESRHSQRESMTEANPRRADHAVDRLFLERWSPRAFTDETIPEANLLSGVPTTAFR